MWRADSEVNLPGGKLLKSVEMGWTPALNKSKPFFIMLLLGGLPS